jgi:hypothetical protein
MMKGRLARAIAILFLLYTGVDRAAPQLCREELRDSDSIVAVSVSESASEPARIIAAINPSGNSQKDQPLKSESDDDDCFCCCTHIVPGTIVVGMPVLDLISPDVTVAHLFIPYPPVRSEYHPPRFV